MDDIAYYFLTLIQNIILIKSINAYDYLEWDFPTPTYRI